MASRCQSKLTVAAILVASLSGVLAQFTCDQAIELHLYALQGLSNCTNPATQNTPLCGLIGTYENSNTSGISASSAFAQVDQLDLINEPTSNIGPWQSYLLQNVMAQGSDLGEVSYVIDQIMPAYSNFSQADGDITSEEYFAAWQEPWYTQGDQNAQQARTLASGSTPDIVGAWQTYWKASNYYFAGLWPNPFSSEAIGRWNDSVTSFNLGLKLHPTWSSSFFSVPFNNGTATAQLPGVFITPNASAKLPVYIITGGTDFPKEMNVLQFGIGALNRGYAVIVYDGPGQGQVIRVPPQMPFYPYWEQVFGQIMGYVSANLTQYVDMSNIINAGVSLGGYLSSVTCSKVGNTVKACVPNPPITNIANIYQQYPAGLASGLYGAFAYVGQQNPSLLPAGYASSFQNGTGIVETLFLTCNASSPAPQLISQAFAQSAGNGGAGPIDPEIIYLSGGYAGAVSGNTEDLFDGIWEGYRRAVTFGPYDIGNITAPVVGIKGTEDDLLGGSEDDFFSQLSPSAAKISTLLTFNDTSGGALHCQAGSPIVRDAEIFSALGAIKAASSGSAAPSTGK